eukprot:g18321.t1
MEAARSFFLDGRGTEDGRIIKKVSAYLVDECWEQLRSEIARPGCTEGLTFVESDGTTKRTAVHEEHFQTAGALKWMCTHASAELHHNLNDDPMYLQLPTDTVGFSENRPKKEVDAQKLPRNSALRYTEGFDHACLVMDRLAGVAEKPHGKPMVGVLPTDSGGSTDSQQVYQVRLHEEHHQESDLIFWPDFCRVHVTANSGGKGFSKFCQIMNRDAKDIEKKLYLAGWICNEKGCAIHNKLARDFGKILPLWGDDSTFPPTDALGRTIENSGLPEKVAKSLKGRIGRTEDGRIVARLSPTGGMDELKTNAHKIYGKTKLPAWTRWFTFFLFCARLRLLMAFGLVNDSLFLLFAAFFTPEFAAPAEMHNRRQLKEDGPPRSLAELEAAHKADVANSQREFVEKLQRDTPQEALRFALSFVGMKEPRNTPDIVMRQVGAVLSRLKNEQTRLRYLEEHAEREAAAAGDTEEEVGSGGKRSYGVVREHGLLMAVLLRSDKLKNLKDKKQRLVLAQNMCKSAEHVAEAQQAVKRLREEKEEQQKTLPEPVVEAAPGEEEKLRTKKALLRMADFYARVETRVLERMARLEHAELKKKKPKSEILADLGGFVPAVVNDAPDVDPEADVAADQVGPEARVLTVADDYLFSNQNDPSRTHDLDRVAIHLAVVPSGGEQEKPRVLVNPIEVVMSRKAVPKGGQAKELPAQNKAVSKYQKRLQELVLLEDYELRAQDGITRKVVGAPPIKRPAADNAVSNAGEPPVKRRAESKPPTQELDEASKKKHTQQKQEQKGKIRRERSVEGFRVTLSGSVSTQRRRGRACDCIEVKVHDSELKSRLLNFQQGGDVDLICRAKKQPRRFFHFAQDEEEFGECLGLVWAARTRFLLERGRRYARDRSFKSQHTVKEMRKALIEAIRPWCARCMELAGGDTSKKDQLRQLAKASDETLARMDPGRVLANVDGPVE